MDPRLYEIYNTELELLQELGAEFAAANPRSAARLRLGERDNPDPFVERLIESVAFLAARTQLKIEARHPAFTQHLLGTVLPAALFPTPSCAVLELTPQPGASALNTGFALAAGSGLRTEPSRSAPSSCEFRTTQAATIWPLVATDARFTNAPGTQSASLPPDLTARAALSWSVSALPGFQLSKLPVQALDFYIAAAPELAARLCDRLLASACGVLVRAGGLGGRSEWLGPEALELLGFEAEQALWPSGRGSFDGYRLLHEYFSFPAKFRFFRLSGLASSFAAAPSGTLEVQVVFDAEDPQLHQRVRATDLRLNCVPVSNLFPRRVDRVDVAPTDTSYRIYPDRNRTLDYEIHSLEKVVGIDAAGKRLAEIKPLYAAGHCEIPGAATAYYSLERQLRLAGAAAGTSPAEVRTDTYIQIVDAHGAAEAGRVCQLEIDALCTNHDLPLRLNLAGNGRALTFIDAVPVESVRCLTGPTWPRPPIAAAESAWRVIGLLGVNYLSLCDSDPAGGVRLLRELLALYVPATDAAGQRQLEGLRRIGYEPVARRVPGAARTCYTRGLLISLELDEQAFAGAGALVFGAVLERFLARYATINSVTQLRLTSTRGNLLKTWPARCGARLIL